MRTGGERHRGTPTSAPLALVTRSGLSPRRSPSPPDTRGSWGGLTPPGQAEAGGHVAAPSAATRRQSERRGLEGPGRAHAKLAAKVSNGTKIQEKSLCRASGSVRPSEPAIPPPRGSPK